jgi:hypothetical protein
MQAQDAAMGDLVNLRHVKKQRARAAASAKAAAQRVLHGRTKAEKQADRAAQARDRAAVDQARLDDKPITSR